MQKMLKTAKIYNKLGHTKSEGFLFYIFAGSLKIDGKMMLKDTFFNGANEYKYEVGPDSCFLKFDAE